MEHRDELMETLKDLLQEVLKARFDGAAYAKLARAHGYADGYMRALLDSGLVSQKELLKLVSEQRRRFIDEAPGATVAA